MRYFISFWVVLATFFIFSGTLQAADVVEKVETQSISNPIEPIEPKANTNKVTFWQKLRKNKAERTQVEPISKSWYLFFGFFMSFIGGGSALYGLFLLLAALFGEISLLLGFLACIVAALPFIFYAIKLFQAAAGVEGKFLKRARFVLGYICGIALLAGILFLGFALATLSFGSAPVFELGIFLGYLLGAIIIGGSVLLFNIIDQKRYKKYQKEQNKAQ